MIRLLPAPTERLRFREMVADDLEIMAAMLGDADVMAFYPAPKSRDESVGWIARMQPTRASRSSVVSSRRPFSPRSSTLTTSRRVAERLGMTHIADDRAHPWIVRTVMGMIVERTAQPPPPAS